MHHAASVQEDQRRRELAQKQTLGNDGLLRCRGRFFDQCCHLGCVRKKDRVAARKFNDLRLGSLRHESLEVRIDHSVLGGKPSPMGPMLLAAGGILSARSDRLSPTSGWTAAT